MLFRSNVSFSKFISMYSEAFRCLYNAVKSSRGSSKVFICLDNCWNQKNAFTICYSARSTLESFAAKISDMQKDVNWNLAYHAYNQPLSDSQFWSGANASMFTSDANTTTFITMRNIQTLTDYVKNKWKRYHAPPLSFRFHTQRCRKSQPDAHPAA